MATNPKNYITPEEYLELERDAERKSEYFNGEIFSMAGTDPRHDLITKKCGRGLDESVAREKVYGLCFQPTSEG